ncbi:NAD(P)H-quinone oxidoreductase subunit O, chloroplastic isoform X1 [Amborella trichopoda]|uniref:NAD(P)H-quinone oxidoreductase subunit O, chloroplastic n=1 Tax=Amborella trichopoda TaxID=13333 RepID=U5DC98_AMBTC|nr:NAD(P)H-quinone oxidoreductase subunit O, chloroplastic isoform X1 [Amborella trichopoda]ERN19865.1 hypothetical protein AMTR_s00071p00027790 [Amborella trichopoda]|eukprot:XP_006858398.1 NAD(P)H-quinone oxidoreductase subunit O, chloroplastic isoform X1 [Amborella trichopoda]
MATATLALSSQSPPTMAAFSASPSPQLTSFNLPSLRRRKPNEFFLVKATANPEAEKEKMVQTESEEVAKAPPKPKKPQYSMKKGQIVRVDKEKYLNSVNYLSVGHPPYYKGLDYIYEDRGEVLDIRIFETGEYALIAWVGIPTAPAWLPTEMLIKSDNLNYERF